MTHWGFESLLSYQKQSKYIMKTDYSKSNVKDMVAARDYIVGSISADGALSFSSYPVAHSDKDAALKEARRLATKEPGKAYVVAQFIGGYVLSGVSSF